MIGFLITCCCWGRLNGFTISKVTQKRPEAITVFIFSLHSYCGHSGQPLGNHWENDLGFLVKDYPMLYAEIGIAIAPEMYRPVLLWSHNN
jgi:hypothetical protein